jgi:hypothetical protein
MKLKSRVMIYYMVGWTSASIYTVYEAATKQLPWIVPAICIPIFALLAYSFLRVRGQVR